MIKENVEVNDSVRDLSTQIEKAAKLIINTLKNKKKILLIGNGGSSAMASHVAAEFVGRYKLERKALPAIALTTDLSSVTAIGNDYGFEAIFERQINALGEEGDALIVLTTSGISKNLIKAVETAKKIGINVIGLLGKGGGKLKKLLASMRASSHASTPSVEIIISSDNTARIQEAHLMILHIICELVDKEFCQKPPVKGR